MPDMRLEPGRGDGPDRGHQAGQGHHAGDDAGGAAARLGALLPRAAAPLAARRRRLRPRTSGRRCATTSPTGTRSASRPRVPLGELRRHPDAQGPAVRHRVHLHHLHPRACGGRRCPGGQPAAGPARHEREGLHGLVPGVLRADADHPRHGRHAAFLREHGRAVVQAAVRHGRPLDLRARRRRQERQRGVRDADRVRHALCDHAALHPGHRRPPATRG